MSDTCDARVAGPASPSEDFDMQSASQKSLSNRTKNRADRLRKALKAVSDEFYPELPLPAYHWYRRVIARCAGFETLFALEQAIRRGDQDILQRLNEENPSYRKSMSLALSDNFGVCVTSKVMQHLWPLIQEKGKGKVIQTIYVSGRPRGLFSPCYSRPELNKHSQSPTDDSLPGLMEKFEEDSKAFARRIYGGKGHETDLKGSFRHYMFDEKAKKKPKTTL